MEKNKLIEMKKRLVALGLAGVMLGTSGCSSNKDENEASNRVAISPKYSDVDEYYKYVLQNGDAVQMYKGENVCLLYDKETYEVTEYIYFGKNILFGLGTHVELYDLLSEEMLVYSDGIGITFNKEYYNELIGSTYHVLLSEASEYIEGYTTKEYYSLEEIRGLEPQVAEGLKAINNAKAKAKTKTE